MVLNNNTATLLLSLFHTCPPTIVAYLYTWQQGKAQHIQVQNSQKRESWPNEGLSLLALGRQKYGWGMLQVRFFLVLAGLHRFPFANQEVANY